MFNRLISLWVHRHYFCTWLLQARFTTRSKWERSMHYLREAYRGFEDEVQSRVHPGDIAGITNCILNRGKLNPVRVVWRTISNPRCRIGYWQPTKYGVTIKPLLNVKRMRPRYMVHPSIMHLCYHLPNNPLFSAGGYVAFATIHAGGLDKWYIYFSKVLVITMKVNCLHLLHTFCALIWSEIDI